MDRPLAWLGSVGGDILVVGIRTIFPGCPHGVYRLVTGCGGNTYTMIM